MHIFTANIPTFHSRYRRYVLITNEFHKFCWSIISRTSDDRKASYGPKSTHIFIMPETRGSHRQYDTRGRCCTNPEPSQAKVEPAGHSLACFWNPLSPCVKLSHQEGNPKWERRCSYKTCLPDHPSQPAGLTSCHTPFRDSGNEASIHVQRCFINTYSNNMINRFHVQ
jgi:hypothetical protein